MRQIVLRPGGRPDGKRICRVCARRFLTAIHSLPAAERAAWGAGLWRRGVPEPLAADEQWRGELRELFAAQVRAALPAEDDRGRALVALGYFAMGMVPEGIEALAAIDPAALEAGSLPDRLLNSLLSRMLDDAALVEGACERVLASLYPAA